MRYFKYKNIKAIEKNALKVQYTEMTKAEKRTVNKETTLKFLGYIVLVIVSFTLVLGSNFLINRIPEPEHWLPAILTLLGILILKFVSFFISLLIGIFVSFPIFKKADETQRIVKQTALSRVCSHLRKYYGLCEPCLVTKCYDASDKKFKDHDVCMFIADGELRITMNLKNVFFREEKDLGCYAFTSDEICLTKKQDKNFLIAELKAENTIFLLGYRAKGFIEKNFLSNI